jgi:hypothetical protein
VHFPLTQKPLWQSSSEEQGDPVFRDEHTEDTHFNPLSHFESLAHAPPSADFWLAKYQNPVPARTATAIIAMTTIFPLPFSNK